MILIDKLIAIGDAFRESHETEDKLSLDQMAVLAANKAEDEEITPAEGVAF